MVVQRQQTTLRRRSEAALEVATVGIFGMYRYVTASLHSMVRGEPSKLTEVSVSASASETIMIPTASGVSTQYGNFCHNSEKPLGPGGRCSCETTDCRAETGSWDHMPAENSHCSVN